MLRAVVAAAIILIAALYYFGYPILVVLLLVALAGTVLDVREVIYQIEAAQGGIAALAVIVGLAHSATAVAATITLRAGRPVPKASFR